jgi:hypothetical protein
MGKRKRKNYNSRLVKMDLLGYVVMHHNGLAINSKAILKHKTLNYEMD